MKGLHAHCHGRSVSRRQFLGTFGAAAAGMLLASPAHAFGGVRHGAARVAVASCSTYERTRVLNTMQGLFDGIGGLGDVIRPGDRIGIKINLTGGIWNAQNYQNQTGLPPGETFWTHPEVLRAVGQLIRDSGASEIYVLEASYDDWGTYAQYGYASATKAFDGTYVDLNKIQPYAGFVARSTGSDAFIYQSFTQNAILNELDCVVSLAKSKQHAEAGVTHGMKNLVGSVPITLYSAGQGSRQALHWHTSYDGDTHSNLCRVIMDLNGATPIRLVVNDAVKTVLGGEGPWHRLHTATFDTFVVSTDPVAADTVATQVIGFDPTANKGSATFPQSLNYLQLASTLGMGVSDPAQIEVVQARPVGSEDEAPVAAGIELAAYPNPFRTRLVLDVTMRTTAYATLAAYDVRGGRVARLLSRTLPVGKTTVEWSGGTDQGLAAGTGMYFVVLESEGRRVTQKVVRAH